MTPTQVSARQIKLLISTGKISAITQLLDQALTVLTPPIRVAEGLSLDSHAAKCAEIFGIPPRLVERAQYVRLVIYPCYTGVLDIHICPGSRLLSSHQLNALLDEGMTHEEEADLEDAEAVCRRFLSWDLKQDEVDDLTSGQVKAKLAAVLGVCEDINDITAT